MKSKLVSIVMPVYNPEWKYLEMALRSFSQQKLNTIELIISDDSENVSVEMEALIHQFKNEFDIHYVRNENGRGIFSNLNNAIRHSKGDYIQIFSQDDVMKDEFIVNQVRAFDLHENIGMVFSAFEEIDSANQINITRGKTLFAPGTSIVIPVNQTSDMFIRYGCFIGNISPVMITREVFDSIGYFNEDLKFASDFEFWVRIGKKKNLFYNNNIGLSVRNHPERASYTLSNHQLVKDLAFIYKQLLESIPSDQLKKSLRHIHKTVGAALVHHAIREVLRFKWLRSDLKRRLHDLNEYPFNSMHAIQFYLLSIPGRIWNRLAI